MSYQLAKHKELGSHSSPAYYLNTFTDGKMVSCAGDNILASWDLQTMMPHNFMVKLDGHPYSCAYDTSTDLLFIGTSTGKLHWINCAEKQEVKLFDLHKKAIYDITPVDNCLYVSSGDGSISVWNISNKTLVRHVPISDNKLRRFEINGKNELLLSDSNGVIHLLDKDLNEQLTINVNDKAVNVCRFYKDYVIAGGWDAHLRFFNRESGTLIKEIPAHNFAIYDLQINHEHGVLASASRDKTIKLWDLRTLELMQRVDHKLGGHNRSVNALKWMCDVLVSTGDDGKVIAWDLRKS